MSPVTALPKTLSEASLQQLVIDYALLRGWRCQHARPARTLRGWATPLTGHPGAPDLLLAREGRVLHIELKSQRGRLTPDQRLWLAALGDYGRVYRPQDWQTIMEELS